MTRIHQVVFVLMVCLRLLVARICSPNINEYYHRQLGDCMKCDSCLRGTGKQKGADLIQWDINHGALSCSPCAPCPTGYFNDIRGYDCRPCNDCSQQNRFQLLQCNKTQNAQCGDVIVSLKLLAKSTTPAILIETNTSKENGIIFTNLIAAVGVATLVILILACFLYFRRQKSTEEKTLMNNNIENLDLTQKLLLATVNNKSKPNGKAENRESKEQAHRKQSETDTRSSHTKRLLCNQTKPKVLVSEDEAHYKSQFRSNIVNNSIKNNLVQPVACHLLCYSNMSDKSLDDVSKNSLTTGYHSLFSDRL